MCIYTVHATLLVLSVLALLVHPFVVSDRGWPTLPYDVVRCRLVLSVLGLPFGEVGFWAESTLWIVLEAALGCADLGGNEWGELVYVSSCSQLHCSRLLFQTPFSPPSLRPRESD